MIRSFIYLDFDKLRSFSSQLFEGVSDYIIETTDSLESEKSQQKGPVGSGRVIADIIKQSYSTSEKKVLEDHAFALFEDQISTEKMIIDLVNHPKSKIELNKFIKVQGSIKINDTSRTTDIIENYNEIGEALYRLTNQDQLLNNNQPNLKKSNAKIKAAIRDANLSIDVKFAESLKTALEFGYRGMLELQINAASHLFSAPVKREFLRENEDLIVQKYSRQTLVNFTMLGVVTQFSADKQTGVSNSKDNKDVSMFEEEPSLKLAMSNLTDGITEIESTFTGPDINEIIIDPLAVYSEL